MDAASLGGPALVVALIFATGAAGLCIFSALRDRPVLAEMGRRALAIASAFVVFAALLLLQAFVTHDFSVAYVANYSSRSLPGAYTMAALWGGMEGSLLFWTVLLTVFSWIALRQARRWADETLSAWSTAVLGGIVIFFLILLVGPADPFVRLSEIPADGQGLNPLLQSPGMLAHPPLLYTGFVG
ncbi:MAG TPA: cytochrome c biogenesis protein CcsA, partial [Actinomycetota bacterium]|nr:cytochrome c biogenesis protein CcsA [Actinomycetota bacterium]